MEVWEVRGHHHAIRVVFIGADQYDSGETPLTEVIDSKCVVEGDNFCH